MSLLPFISDDDLIAATQTLLNAAINAERKVEKNPYRNVIDPFSALIDAARQNISTADWMSQEKARQVQKGFQNALGDFHQEILGSMPGWKNAGLGGSYDVINEDLKIIAEIKNKYNTMNARSALSVYDNLSRHIDYSEAKITKSYLVEIVPKNSRPYEVRFAPSERGTRRPSRPDIVRIDGKSFYALASGYQDALKRLYEVLPDVLSKIINITPRQLSDSKYFLELFSRVYM